MYGCEFDERVAEDAPSTTIPGGPRELVLVKRIPGDCLRRMKGAVTGGVVDGEPGGAALRGTHPVLLEGGHALAAGQNSARRANTMHCDTLH